MTRDAAVPENKCRAGYYTGNFKGKYKPGALGLGIFGSSFEVDIEGGKSFFDDSLPAFAFTLVEEIKPAGEVTIYSVRGGCMQGLATALAITQSPVVAKLTGDLDCATGNFTGMLEGYYTFIGLPGADYTFTGPVTGQLIPGDVPSGEGRWTVSEPAALDGTPAGGGEGTWDAKWTSNDPPVLRVDPCASIGPGGAHTPIVDDAGQPLSPIDGGVP